MSSLTTQFLIAFHYCAYLSSEDGTLLNICSNSSMSFSWKFSWLNYLCLKKICNKHVIETIFTLLFLQTRGFFVLFLEYLANWLRCLTLLNICAVLILISCFYWFIFRFSYREDANPSQHLELWMLTFYKELQIIES